MRVTRNRPQLSADTIALLKRYCPTLSPDEAVQSLAKEYDAQVLYGLRTNADKLRLQADRNTREAQEYQQWIDNGRPL